LEGDGRALVPVLFGDFPAGTEENFRNLSEDPAEIRTLHLPKSFRGGLSPHANPIGAYQLFVVDYFIS
jgi:hypothetical protein